MKRCLIVIGILVMALLTATGCSKTFRPSVDAVLGASGGTVESAGGDFQLTVPPTALTEDTDISIEVSSQQDTFGADQASDVWQVSGLDNLLVPVTVQIRATAPLKGTTYVAVSVPGKTASYPELTESVLYMPCSVEKDVVTFTLGPQQKTTLLNRLLASAGSLGSVAYADTKSKTFLAAIVTGRASGISPSGKFNVIADASVRSADIDNVTAYMDYLYQFYETLGFDLDQYSNWPLTVNIRGLGLTERNWFGNKEQPAGFFVIPNFGSREIIVNKEMLGNSLEVRTTLIHEFFHFVQTLHGSNTWFNEATATWSEEYYKSNSGLIPANYKANGETDLQVFEGPFAAVGRSEAQQGYGSASLVKYLVNRYGKESLARVYSNIGQYSSQIDILDSYAPMESWMNEYYIQLITGKLYKSGSFSPLSLAADLQPIRISPPAPAENASAPSDLSKTTVTVPAMGCRAVLLEMTADDIPKLSERASLLVKANVETAGINIMRYSGTADLLGTGNGKASTGQLRQNLGTRGRLMVYVSNLTRQPLDIELTFKVQNAPPLEELIGDWDGTSTFMKVYIDPKFEKELTDPQSGEELDSCDEAMLELVKSMIQQLKALQGQTMPAKLRLEQKASNSGTLASPIDVSRKGAFDFTQVYPFTYQDGLLVSETVQTQKEGRSVIRYDLSASYQEANVVIEGPLKISLQSTRTMLEFIVQLKYVRPAAAQ